MQNNAATAQIETGGQGVVFDPHHARDTLRLAAMAVRRNYPMSDAIRMEMVQTATAIMREGGDREKLRAIEYLFAIDCKQAELLLDLWKAQRVDSGESSENIAVSVVDADRIAAIAKTLNNDTRLS